MCGGLQQGAQISTLESHLSVLPTEFPHMLKISSLHLFLTPLTPTTFMFLFHYHCEISPSPPACQVGLKSSLSLLWTSAEPSQSGLPAFTSNTSNVPLLSSVLRVSIAKVTPHPLQRLRSSSVKFSVDKTRHSYKNKTKLCILLQSCNLYFFSFVELCIVNLLKITFFQYF